MDNQTKMTPGEFYFHWNLINATLHPSDFHWCKHSHFLYIYYYIYVSMNAYIKNNIIIATVL